MAQPPGSGTPPRRAGTTGVSTLALAAVLLPISAPAQQITNRELYTKSLRAALQPEAEYGLYDNPEEVERVNRIGYQLAHKSEYAEFPFTFTLVDLPIPNAFALPAGQIFITRGMLDLGLDDDMLAALLGHEIAHVTRQHFLRMKRKAALLNTLSTLVMAGAVYAASQSRGDEVLTPYGVVRDDNTARLAQGAIQASVLASELLLRGYSREHEDEADEEGQRLAASAGYHPAGAHHLMERMSQRIAQTETYGYLQTHPFLDDRARSALARAPSFKVAGERPDNAAYRERSQRALLDFLTGAELDPELVRVVERSALVAWPRGDAADRLRFEALEREREVELAKTSFNRDFGRLLRRYTAELRAVEELSPESPLIPRLRDQIGALRAEVEELYPKARAVLARGVYETPFLEAFRSNYPDATESARVALDLGTAYSRLGRQTDAVTYLLEAWEAAPDEGLAQQARAGLHNLVPVLEQLGGLELLATQSRDPALAQVALGRLEDEARTYKEVENGAAYLLRFPSGLYADTVRHRLDVLADKLYTDMTLYQQLGDSAKAVERARRILVNAPLSPAAKRLRDEQAQTPAGDQGAPAFP